MQGEGPRSPARRHDAGESPAWTLGVMYPLPLSSDESSHLSFYGTRTTALS